MTREKLPGDEHRRSAAEPLRRTDARFLDEASGEAALVAATHARKLADVAGEMVALPANQIADTARRRAQSVLDTCQGIARVTEAERQHLLEVLSEGGVDIAQPAMAGAPETGQFHRFEIRVPKDRVRECISLLENADYTRWESWRGGAWTVYMRTNTHMTLVKADEHGKRVVLRWSDDAPRGNRQSRFTPTDADLGAVELPNALWPAYYMLRVLRAVREKVTGRAARTRFAPFLGTPSALVEPLLEFAGIRRSDVLYDLGCGDGRVVIEAACSTGCRAVGIEHDPTLVSLGRARIVELELQDRVRIELGDAEEADLSDASAVFLFLPPGAIARLLPVLRHRLSPGARILAHEQLAFEAEPAPDRCELVLGAGALTVARLWQL